MYTLWHQFLCHSCLLSLNLFICSASPLYHIVIPDYTIHSDNTSLAVHWYGNSSLTVTVGIRNSTTFLTNVTKVIQKDSIEILILPGIGKVPPFNQLELVVNGSSQNGSVFSDTRILRAMQSKNSSIFIQTDKVLYRPGDAVHIRIIAIYQNLKANTGEVDLVIRDPTGNIVKQHLNMKSDLGVISTHFQLANSPMLGEWNIQATISNDENVNMVLFSVAENVFQKFEVTLDAPPFFISRKENYTGTVMAKYYYGKPVSGNLTVSIKPLYFEVYAEINKTYEISGSVNFIFTNEEMSVIMYWSGFNITATVYEELTGIAVEESSFVRIENSEYRLNIISQKPVFEPGLKFTAQIRVQRADNKALTTQEREKPVSVKITQGAVVFASTTRAMVETSDTPNNVFWQNYTISESGIVNLEFPIVQSVQWFYVEVEYQTATERLYFEKPTLGNPSIQINVSETSLQVGTPFHLQVNTYPEVQDFYYVVIANRMVVAAGKNKTTLSLTPQNSWFPTAQMIVYIRILNSSFGDIIQNVQTLPITLPNSLKNQVNLSWSKNNAKPLENITLSVNVKESRSLVGLRIVEKSSTLLEERNDLTTSRVDNDLLTYFYQNYPVIMTDAVIYYTFGVPIFSSNGDFNREEISPRKNKSEFIETWIWLETNISSSLSRNLQLTVPDKNTTWVATAFVMSEGLGLGITDSSIELSVLKPLFITVNMPNMLTRGEGFILEVMLSNSLDEDTEVVITLESSNSFDIIVPDNNSGVVAGQRKVPVFRKNGSIVLFPIKPKVLGNITITVTATSKVASDTLTKYVVVRAEGVKYYYSEAVLFQIPGSANASSTVSKNFSFTFPSDLVQGSEEAFITVVGDLLGPSINGLESLIGMPYGCGEQNMIVFAPNIYILLYLIATNQLKDNIREKVIDFMEKGYQRELLYRHYDGSFSAFGNSDAFGSTWLTSFVIRCFLQARPFIYISPDVLNQSVNFLVQYQDMNTGVFSEPGNVLHRDLQGGLNGPIALTAYILVSLLEDENYKHLYEANVQKAVQYLEGQYDHGITSNYTLSVVVYALTLANSTIAMDALTILNSRATVTVDDGTKYWSTPSESANFYWQPRTTDIETAAYALLSFRWQNRISEGIPVMKWLSQQRNQLGGYVSTQDTVMALQALSQFASALKSSETSLTVTVTGPGSFVQKTFQVNSNLIDLQSKQIEVLQPLSVTATAVGYGMALVQLNVVYNRKPPSRRRRSTVPEAFKLDLKVHEDASNIHKLTLDVSMSYQGEGNETGMVIVEVELLNGFQLSANGIPTNEKVGLVESKDNKVNLYLYSLTRDTVIVSVPMVRYASVAGSQDAVVRITEYYNPRNTGTQTYNSATMEKISLCDFCGFNCTQCRSNVQIKGEPVPKPNSASTYTFFMLSFSMVFLPYLF